MTTIHPDLRPGLRALALTRTSEVDARVKFSHADQLSIVAELALREGVINEEQAQALEKIGASPLAPDSSIGLRQREGTALFVRFSIGALGVLMYRGSAAERDEQMVALFQRHLARALIDSQSQILIAAEPKRLGRTATDHENLLFQAIRTNGIHKVIVERETLNILSETGKTRLAKLLVDAAEDRDSLVRKLTDRRARQEERDNRWARGQPPPAGYTLVNDREVIVDDEVRDVIVNYVLPALDGGAPLQSIAQLLVELRVVGPRIGGTGVWRVLDTHEQYPAPYQPDVRAFCRGIDAWITGYYRIDEHCPLEADYYLGQPVQRDEHGQLFVTTTYHTGSLELSPSQERIARAANDVLTKQSNLPNRKRRHPYSGTRFLHQDTEWRLRGYTGYLGDRRYCVEDETGETVAVIGADFEPQIVEEVVRALSTGTTARQVTEDLPREWRAWLQPTALRLQFLAESTEDLRQQLDHAVLQSTTARTEAVRSRFARVAEDIGARLEQTESELSTLRTTASDDWQLQSDLVPRALAHLARGESPEDDPLFAPVIQKVLAIVVAPDVPGLLRISATLRAPSTDGITEFAPVTITVRDLSSQYLGDPESVHERALWEAGRWLTADVGMELCELAGPLADSGRAARYRLTNALAQHMPKGAAQLIMEHPARTARAAAWRAICPNPGYVETAESETMPDGFEERIRQTYILSTFGNLPRRSFFRSTANGRALQDLIVHHNGKAPATDLQLTLKKSGLTDSSARQRTAKMATARTVDVVSGGARRIVLGVRQCACGGDFSSFVSAPEVQDHLLCRRCLRDPSGQEFPEEYRSLEGDQLALLDLRRSDVTERRVARLSGQNKGQLLRAKAREHGFDVRVHGHLPRGLERNVLRRDALVQSVHALLGKGQDPLEELSSEWKEVARTVRKLDVDNLLTAPLLARILEEGTGAEWRQRARQADLGIPARGPVAVAVRLQVVLAENSND